MITLYLHLGNDVVVKMSDVVGIFDLEKISISKYTKSFLSSATKNNLVTNVSYEMPKSFVVCNHSKYNKNETRVYISQISCATLQKRAYG